MTNRYYVAFMTPDGVLGAAEILLELPVRTRADVNVIADMLAEQGYDDATILGFSRFEEAGR